MKADDQLTSSIKTEMTVMVADVTSNQARLYCGEKSYPCVVGRGGVTSDKIEGDHKTPLGRFALRTVYYRPDRILDLKKLSLPTFPLRPEWGWCDDPDDPLYNQRIARPYDGHHEVMWRDDHLYDLVVVLSYNEPPSTPGKGSAIFLHVAPNDFSGTEGCIALSLSDLREVLVNCNADAWLTVRVVDDA
tara:strand:+ start:770 stop:1336 length:567 start_codon:yes stop_codon:yes gene_type:complete